MSRELRRRCRRVAQMLSSAVDKHLENIMDEEAIVDELVLQTPRPSFKILITNHESEKLREYKNLRPIERRRLGTVKHLLVDVFTTGVHKYQRIKF